MLAVLALLAVSAMDADAEVLVRWDQDRIPPPQALGLSTVVIPATRSAAIRAALDQGYRVSVEIDAAHAATFKPVDGATGVIVKGAIAPEELVRLSRSLGGSVASVRVADDRGKWPHIRTNWVTRNKDVLQVTNRSAQPWLENNEALVRIATPTGAATGPLLLTYRWEPVTVADLDQGPRLENYLVAIAEAGSLGADLLLPLHERFEQALLLASPDARAEWAEIRAFIEFYAWNAPFQHRPIANVGVVTADPMRSFELMNLLARHNLPFVPMAPAAVHLKALAGLDLLIVLDDLDSNGAQQLGQFAAGGGVVLIAGTSATKPGISSTSRPWRGATDSIKGEDRTIYPYGKGRVVEAPTPPLDPNTFALEMRQLLGVERRVIDIWNGITVLIAPFARPDGGGVLLTAINYAAQPLPIQVRVRGTFSEVQYEAPDQSTVLLPFEVKDGGTEFVLPALRIGARVFLNRFP